MGARIWKNKREAQEAAKEFTEILKVLEGEVGEKKYFGRGRFGYEDTSLILFGCWYYSYDTCGSFNVECPKLMTWVRRCMGRECLEDASGSAQDL